MAKRGLTHVNQVSLEDALLKIFAHHSGIKNSREELSLKLPNSGSSLEVDVWYPSLKLCFEYQDEYHYQYMFYYNKPLASIQKVDQIKRKLILERGETLILVPCWWDGSISSLQNTINFYRPDLSLPQLPASDMIPINPPYKFFSDVAQLMLVSSSQPETVEVSKQNQWWLGEKYDGMRCCWKPTERHLHSRRGYLIALHPPMFNLFGSVAIDGEIWCGRGQFLETNHLIQSALYSTLNWSFLRVVCFDEGAQKETLPYESRYALVLFHLHPSQSVTLMAPRVMCWDQQQLTQCLQQVVEDGGEGLILQKVASLYHAGRSTELLKIKNVKKDREALVVEVKEDGSLLLKLPDGNHFVVSRGDCLLHRRAVSGDIVSFTYDAPRQCLTQVNYGVDKRRTVYGWLPFNPIVYRFRDDLSWEDVSRDSSPFFVPENANQKVMESISPRKQNATRIQHKNLQLVKGLLEKFVLKKGLDPLVAETWYRVSLREVMQNKVIRKYLEHYRSLYKALVHLYPNMKLDKLKFQLRGYWSDKANLRKWFDEFSQIKKFDPLVPQNWYPVTHADVAAVQSGKTVLRCYNASLTNAIMDLYPEVPFKPYFLYTPKNHWSDHAQRRKWFNEFASSKNLDPLNPDHWYSVSFRAIKAAKGGRAMLTHYGDNMAKAIMDVYPDIALKRHKFFRVDGEYWKDIRNWRNWFDEFAASRSLILSLLAIGTKLLLLKFILPPKEIKSYDISNHLRKLLLKSILN